MNEKKIVKTCEHCIIRDYIDISPEESQPIIYCTWCFTCFPLDFQLVKPPQIDSLHE